MHKDTAPVEERLDRFVRDRLLPAMYLDPQPLSVSAWQVPREPVPFAFATGQKFEPVTVGWKFGRAWSTVWLRVQGSIPTHWATANQTQLTPEVLIDFGYNTSRSGFQAEALAFDASGKPIKAVAPKNSWIPWSLDQSKIDFYLEVAANPDVAGEYTFTPTEFGDWDTSPEDALYELKHLHIALRDLRVWELVQDFWTIRGLISALPAENTRRHGLLRAIEQALNAINPDDISATAEAARAVLRPALELPASASGHRIIATGNAHIDSAWLWPLRETVRKCARTFSNVLSLMEDHPDFVFSGSAAQHYAWLKDDYPEIFEGIKKRVATGQWKPVGGMWVECDGNLPGSEAMVRQFVLGQQFFREHFGVTCVEAWLPDSFGYSGALPQIVKQAGIKYFLSQKLSWNQVNAMPHHTFWWEGIDGSRVFTHFPSVDMYISELSGEELAHAERNFADKGKASVSLVPYGWGDGGGGPTREMLAAAARTANLEGSPRVTLGSAEQFFDQALAEYRDAPVWRGEMYLELHRAVYTTQHRTKQGNRRNEALLREAELWAATASIRVGSDYPAKEFKAIWESLLLMQFHDILPGASIAWVYREAEQRHRELSDALNQIIDRSLAALTQASSGAGETTQTLIANAAPTARNGVAALAIGPAESSANPVSITEASGLTSFDNGLVRASLDAKGQLVSLINLADGREAIAEGHPANVFQMHHDLPVKWDAWDIDAYYRQVQWQLDEVSEREVGHGASGEAWLKTIRTFSSPGRTASRIEQRVILSPGRADIDLEISVDWHEAEKILKLAFPIDIHCEQAAAETQYGHIWRPTHVNTSWEAAKFEMPQHRFLYLPERDWGVAFANESSYGYDLGRTTETDGKTITTVRFSLLRSPKFPDPEADQGKHEIRLRIRPGATLQEAVNLGYELNLPIRKIAGNRSLAALVASDSAQCIIEAVKLAEDGSGDLIVRCYESLGGRAQTRIVLAGTAGKIQRTNLLEEPIEGEPIASGSTVDLELRPFQIVTLRFSGVQA